MSLNLNAVPTRWQSKATPYIDLLVKAFSAEGISNITVYAYACASITYESSWNPSVENRRDRAAQTPYSGKGLAQITLESNYQKISQFTGINFLTNPGLMFNPYYSLRAKAAHFLIHGMIPYIIHGEFEAAAGIYNAGKPNYRSIYTGRVARATLEWLPVFSAPPVMTYIPSLNYPPIFKHEEQRPFSKPPKYTAPPRYNTAHYAPPPRLVTAPIFSAPPSLYAPPVLNAPARYNSGRGNTHHQPPRYTAPSIIITKPPRPKIYIIQRGDNLSAIASHFKISLRTLLANNRKIKNPNRIYIGQKINIPR